MPERWCDKRTDDETDAGMRRVTCIRTEQVTRGEESNVNVSLFQGREPRERVGNEVTTRGRA